MLKRLLLFSLAVIGAFWLISGTNSKLNTEKLDENLSESLHKTLGQIERYFANQDFEGLLESELLKKSNDKDSTDKKAPPDEEERYLVTRVIDGDTIELEGGLKLRYIGIDTPETVHPSKPVEYFGQEASNKNKELVLNKVVRLEKDVSNTDRYGRLLRYVYTEDGLFVNDYLVREGYAKVYTYPPDVKYAEQFVEAQEEARQHKRGLWQKGRNN